MAVVKVPLPPIDSNVFSAGWGYITTIAAGMWKTLAIFTVQLLKIEKTNTLEWPEQAATYSDRFKGKHFLTLRDDGEVRCTACFLCATNCPADCIHIEAGNHPDNELEKFPVRFEIDILRCVFCGYCEEACPVDAIRLGPEYAMVGTNGGKWVYTKEYLAERKQLSGGVVSVKDENEKHPIVEAPKGSRNAKQIKSYARHGIH